MMSFFKKEHNKDPREDKEKKKVDKKNIFNNSKMNDTFNETSNMSLIIEGQSISITNSNNETSNNNLHCSSYVSLSPKLSSSSKSSIDSSNLALQQKNQLHSTALGVPSIAPKPKKGILKTMSKFGIGPTLSNMSTQSNMVPNQSSLLSNSSNSGNLSSTNHLPALSTIILSPKIHSKPTDSSYLKSTSSIPLSGQPSNTRNLINESLSNFTKQSSSQYFTDLNLQSNTTSNGTCATKTSNNGDSSLTLPKLNKFPYYLLTLDDLEKSVCLMRTIEVPLGLINYLELKNYTFNPQQSKNKPILIEINGCGSKFFPGDQLIEVNEEVVIYKSLAECKKLIDKFINEDGVEVLTFKVKTALVNSELFLCNDGRFRPSYLFYSNGAGDFYSRAIKSTDNIKNKEYNNELNTQPTDSSSSSNSSLNSIIQDETDMSNVWLVHTNGFTQTKIFAKIIQKITAGANTNESFYSGGNQIRYKVKLENNTLVEVNEEYLEKANPSPQYDFCEDLSKLRFINESSLLHCLRQRYLSKRLIHTYLTRQSLICIKPYFSQSNESYQHVYNNKLVSLFKGCKQEDMPPHIYSYTQSVYRSMLTNRQDQSFIMTGQSGSGKTQTTKHVLSYLFKVSHPISNIFNETKLEALFCLLNAFCSASTNKNSCANRFLNIFLLEFSHTGQLVSILLQLITFDHTRLIYQPKNESTYQIFSHLLNGPTSVLQDLQLNDLNLDSIDCVDKLLSSNLFYQLLSSKKSNEENDTDTLIFKRVLDSFKILNFNENETKSILNLLGAIVHLNLAGTCNALSNSSTPSTTNNLANNYYRVGQFRSPNDAHKAANLLGISYNQLNDAIFTLVNSQTSQGTGLGAAPRNKYSHFSNSGSSRVSPETSPLANLTADECLQGFCMGLYQECLSLLVNCINRAFKQTSNQNQGICNSILLIDPPGFQSQSDPGSPLSYSDLMCNYINERLQLMFYQINFISPIEKFAQEGLDNSDLVDHIPESPSSLVNWLDRPPAPNTVLSRSTNVCSADASCGLLWLLEEQIFNNEIKTNDQFISKLAEFDAKQNFLKLDKQKNSFTLYHQFGQFPVEYNISNWLETYNKEFITQRNALTLLQLSRKDIISNTFTNSTAMSNAAATLNTTFNGNSAQNSYLASSLNAHYDYNSNTSSTSLKRQASVRKMLTLSKRKSFIINFKLQVDSVFDSIRKTKPNFVFCLLPDKRISSEKREFLDEVNVPFLRSQLKAYQLLAACRIYRQGYPDFLNFEEFQRRFVMFISTESVHITANANDEMKQNCLSLIKFFDLDSSCYKIGITQIFFKAGILNKLEEKRDEKINSFIIKLQTNCRRFLAIKSYNKKKVQHSAVCCLQKNIRIFFALKKWKWWHLHTNLMPILNVQSNETINKQLREELGQMHRKFDRLSNEKNELKVANSQLENKLMNLQTVYVEEQATNAGAIDLLEAETSSRIQLENEVNELRPLYNEAMKKLETFETEMLELRLYNTKKSIENELEKDDIDGLSSPNNHLLLSPTTNSPSNCNDELISYGFKLKASSHELDKLRRENDNLKRKLQDKKDETEKLNVNERNMFDLRLKERDTEFFEIEKQNTILKRKYQKLSEEMQDIQRMLEDNQIRNRELEKIQSRFDIDIHTLQSKLRDEIENREKCERERDQAVYEISSLKRDIDSQKQEITNQVEKTERLERDLKEYEVSVGATGNDNGEQLLKLKSQIREYESKLKDQEDELDEQSCTIQQLEQTKLRLDLQLEKEKQKWQREVAEKESEMDDLRFHTQKKIKAIEMQLEEEGELSNNLQREKRELERKLRESSLPTNSQYTTQFNLNGNSFDYINKLKKHMLKYKTLAIDAQTQLEKLKEIMPKQSITKSLKLQLEDSEIAKTNALKSKQFLQVEVENLQQQLYESNAHKQNLEEQNIHLNHELKNLRSEMEEQEREIDETIKKYQNHVQNYSLDSHRFIDLNNQVDILAMENSLLKDKVRAMEEKINNYENFWIDKTILNKLESKLRDYENKLEFEQVQKNKLQNQIERLKVQYESSLGEIEIILVREKRCEDQLKKAQRTNKETLEEFGDVKKRLIDLEENKKRLEKENEILDKELETLKMELKVNLNRLDALQIALNSINESEEEHENDFEMDYDQEYEDVGESITNYTDLNEG